ncbi:GntR family transcriptional regulator [Curtobacterium sp. Leaf261]|nr:GntR family transcriptional regulator [Curtobacterium sp. Leaf261]
MTVPGQRVFEVTADRIAADLESGGAAPGDRLPPERDLAVRYGVSRVTLRSALAELAERGIVASAASRGWFVSPPAVLPTTGVQGFAELAAAKGLPTSARVMESEVRASTVDEADRLGIAPGAPVFSLVRLRAIDGNVVVHEHNRIPLAICPEIVDVDFRTASLFTTLRTASPPQIPIVANYEVEARHPTAEERSLLEILDATPVLVADQVALNADRKPIEMTRAVYRADRYRFRGSIAH